MTEILNLNEIRMNLNEIILNETINLNEKMAEEFFFQMDFPPLVGSVKNPERFVETLFVNNSTFDCKYLAELFNYEHEEMFGCHVDFMPHTLEVWKMFMNHFVSLEDVQEFDKSTFHLHFVRC